MLTIAMFMKNTKPRERRKDLNKKKTVFIDRPLQEMLF